MDKPQLILAVSSARLLAQCYVGPGITPVPFDKMCHSLQTAGLFLGPRSLLEDDPAFLQIIPYVVLKQGDKYIRYLRTPNGGEARLHGKASIGAGGHIDARDVMFARDSSVTLDVTLGLAAMREVVEEFGLPEKSPVITRIGLLADFSDNVGMVHLGVVEVWDVDPAFKLESKENSQAEVGLFTLEELEQDQPRMEKWSQHVLDYLISQR
jgi:predicted NUDIX family phosphoesterase